MFLLSFGTISRVSLRERSGRRGRGGGGREGTNMGNKVQILISVVKITDHSSYAIILCSNNEDRHTSIPFHYHTT